MYMICRIMMRISFIFFHLFAVPCVQAPASVAALKKRLGGSVDVVFAADCIFQTLFGDAVPLLEVLSRLCDERTVVLLAGGGDGEAFICLL